MNGFLNSFMSPMRLSFACLCRCLRVCLREQAKVLSKQVANTLEVVALNIKGDDRALVNMAADLEAHTHVPLHYAMLLYTMQCCFALYMASLHYAWLL